MSGQEPERDTHTTDGFALPTAVVKEVAKDAGKKESCREKKEDPLRACRERKGASILLEGITTEMTPDAQLARLVANFKNIAFTYTMESKGETQVTGIFETGKGEGDCGVVARVMVKVATECLLIEDVATTRKSPEEGFVAPGVLTIDPNKSPNVSDGSLWLFDAHTWVLGPNGKEYDPLFGDMADKTGWSDLVSKEQDYKPYYIDKYVYENDHVLYGRFTGEGNEDHAFTEGWEEEVWQRHRGFYVAMAKSQMEQQVKKTIKELPSERFEETVSILLRIEKAKGRDFKKFEEFEAMSDFDEDAWKYTYNEDKWNGWRGANAE
ncbi:MAG: hypothetical protein IID36_09110 [Planctomycetes bacterium]|nr:hypothetical protein [Planctomycetota bacterium]